MIYHTSKTKTLNTEFSGDRLWCNDVRSNLTLLPIAPKLPNQKDLRLESLKILLISKIILYFI